MGCGCNRDLETGINPRLSGETPKHHRVRLAEQPLDKRKTASDGDSTTISDIAVTPGQFVIKNTGSINNNYIIKAKLGEGIIA